MDTGFEEFVSSGSPPVTDFRPIATYDPDGDCIEFFASNENYYARRLDSMVTAYYSMETDEVVGSLIKGVSRILKEAAERIPGVRIEIEGQRIKLEHVFTICLWGPARDPKSMEVVIYNKLRDAAATNGIELEAAPIAHELATA